MPAYASNIACRVQQRCNLPNAPPACCTEAAETVSVTGQAKVWWYSRWAGSLMHIPESSPLQLTWSWLQGRPLLPLRPLLPRPSLLPRCALLLPQRALLLPQRALLLPQRALLLPRRPLLPRRTRLPWRTLLPPLWSPPGRVLWLDLHLDRCRRLGLGHVHRPCALLCRQGLGAGLSPTCTTQQTVEKCL